MRDLCACALATLVAAGAAVYSGCSSSSGSTGTGGDTGDDVGTSSGSGGGGSSGSSGAGASSGSSGAGTSSGSSSGGSQTGGDASPGGDDSGTSTNEPDATVGTDGGHTHADAAAAADSAPPGDSGPGLESDASSDESAWLDPMNAARAAVMANEPALTWNPVAAQVALAYAQQCDYAHNPNRNADYKTAGGGSGGLGENIAAGAPSLTIAGANMGWINQEKPAYDYTTNTCNTSVAPECGHYTQVVWKTTTSVGCALVTCNVNSPFDTSKYGTKWGFAVCDYAPPGNIVNGGTLEKPY